MLLPSSSPAKRHTVGKPPKLPSNERLPSHVEKFAKSSISFFTKRCKALRALAKSACPAQ